jgi:hypothetical protein
MNKLLLSVAVLISSAASLQAARDFQTCKPGVTLRLDPVIFLGDLVIDTKGQLTEMLKTINQTNEFSFNSTFGNSKVMYHITKIGKYKVSHPNKVLKKVTIPVSKDIEINVGDKIEVGPMTYFTVKSIRKTKKIDQRKDLLLIESY